jgi:hypothetical protein
MPFPHVPNIQPTQTGAEQSAQSRLPAMPLPVASFADSHHDSARPPCVCYAPSAEMDLRRGSDQLMWTIMDAWNLLGPCESL